MSETMRNVLSAFLYRTGGRILYAQTSCQFNGSSRDTMESTGSTRNTLEGTGSTRNTMEGRPSGPSARRRRLCCGPRAAECTLSAVLLRLRAVRCMLHVGACQWPQQNSKVGDSAACCGPWAVGRHGERQVRARVCDEPAAPARLGESPKSPKQTQTPEPMSTRTGGWAVPASALIPSAMRARAC